MMTNDGDARREIATYAGLLWRRGLVAGNSGNISVRLDDGTLLVTPTGASLRALAPDDIVATTSDGTPLDPTRRPTSELPLHLAAYRVRPEIRCVVHTHPTYCVAWSKTGRLFPCDTVGAIESLGTIAWTRYARSGSAELAELCSQAFARSIDTIVMARHGLSSVGLDLETAFVRTDLAEQTAHIEHAAHALRASNVRAIDGAAVPLPFDDLHAVASDDAARSALVDFRREYGSAAPDATRLHAHADRLRGYATVAGPFERWWLDPRVQAFVSELNATGL
ncbi:MAG: hypothetical protein NVS2B8_04920 [Vulcanimicrobiaceae bacterium]